ncbi:hypothetical protein C8R47DRAFT_610095 [Mycena vitilis]|nr:hypothetical protein C8R47DRAFT_610095 [Mycena vitilis]
MPFDMIGNQDRCCPGIRTIHHEPCVCLPGGRWRRNFPEYRYMRRQFRASRLPVATHNPSPCRTFYFKLAVFRGFLIFVTVRVAHLSPPFNLKSCLASGHFINPHNPQHQQHQQPPSLSPCQPNSQRSSLQNISPQSDSPISLLRFYTSSSPIVLRAAKASGHSSSVIQYCAIYLNHLIVAIADIFPAFPKFDLRASQVHGRGASSFRRWRLVCFDVNKLKGGI